ncbi:MAG TPA: type IV pilus secretin PilQ [Candidatus Sulfotelmatobacter sp.]|jgi:type IV pilus assembly protein PilQ|nr:type IV pilus secretin PilQ [Candidatus Sulfotelmatobacter sp.]
MKTNWPAFRCGCLIVATVVLGGGSAAVRGQEPAGATSTAAVISSVAITQEPQRAAIRVEGAGRLEVHTSRMQNPERLVLDFSGARLGVQRTAIPGVSAPVRGVRIGQFRPDIARVVVDLTGETPFQITHEGDAVVIYFQMQVTPEANVVAPVTSTSLESPKKPMDYATNAPKTGAHRSNSSNVAAPRFSLPSELTQPTVVLASLHEKSAPVRPDGASQQAAQQATMAATTVAAQQGSSASNVPQAGHYTGEPISVNLKDVDLKDFFRLIHEISGLNVVLDPNVKGTLTIVLDEVPWDQALDIVLQNNSLDKQLTGNVLRVATRETLKREAETERDLEKAQAEAVAPVTVTRVLSYAKATTMKDTLKKFLSARGDILSDDRSNQLIIRDIPSVIPTIDNLIRQLDRKSQQVEIEARVVSASRSFAQDIGVQWGFAGTTTGGRTIFGAPASVGVSPVTTGAGIPQPPLIGTPPSGSGSSTPGLPLNVNLGAGVPTSGFYIGHRSPNFAVDLFITAAESKGVGKLLSKPKVITQNNEKAIVKQGTKIPIQTVINNTISVQYIDAVLQLEVTPQITAEGTVFMDVLVENTQIDNGIPRVQGIPALDTQAAQTKVTVADGGTVVIGGIIVTQQQTNITEVPIVGSLPIIGYLFRRTNVSVTSQELLFFITPRIMPG